MKDKLEPNISLDFNPLFGLRNPAKLLKEIYVTRFKKKQSVKRLITQKHNKGTLS